LYYFFNVIIYHNAVSITITPFPPLLSFPLNLSFYGILNAVQTQCGESADTTDYSF